MDMTSYDGKGIFTGCLHLCRCTVATAAAATTATTTATIAATIAAFTAMSTVMFAVITTSVTVSTCSTNPALSFWSMCQHYPSRQKSGLCRSILALCMWWLAGQWSRRRSTFLEKKVDGMKGCDLVMTVIAAIMCLGTVLGSGYIM
eukprot:14037121-Ditylum_brightwellii.AAC.1